MGGVLYYTEAAEVPRVMGDLLARVADVTARTPFRELTDIYRDFLYVHPFIDGNGRTARILLDYLMMRAHFPPVPHDGDLTKNVVFYSAEEYYVRVCLAYARAASARDGRFAPARWLRSRLGY
jgi:Fic family protein